MAFSFCRLFLSFHAPSEFMSLFLRHTTRRKEGLRKVLDDKNVGDSEAVRRYFFGTKGEDRNSFVSIHRNKFAVQKQRLSDGAMKNAH